MSTLASFSLTEILEGSQQLDERLLEDEILEFTAPEPTEVILARIKKYTGKYAITTKRDWYEIGRRIVVEGEKIKRMHNESKVGARRTYWFYNVDLGNWSGPSPRQLGKMNKEQFEQLLAEREQTVRWIEQLIQEDEERNNENEIVGDNFIAEGEGLLEHVLLEHETGGLTPPPADRFLEGNEEQFAPQ